MCCFCIVALVLSPHGGLVSPMRGSTRQSKRQALVAAYLLFSTRSSFPTCGARLDGPVTTSEHHMQIPFMAMISQLWALLSSSCGPCSPPAVGLALLRLWALLTCSCGPCSPAAVGLAYLQPNAFVFCALSSNERWLSTRSWWICSLLPLTCAPCCLVAQTR
jgi:hypothetical protein